MSLSSRWCSWGRTGWEWGGYNHCHVHPVLEALTQHIGETKSSFYPISGPVFRVLKQSLGEAHSEK